MTAVQTASRLMFVVYARRCALNARQSRLYLHFWEHHVSAYLPGGMEGFPIARLSYDHMPDHDRIYDLDALIYCITRRHTHIFRADGETMLVMNV